MGRVVVMESEGLGRREWSSKVWNGIKRDSVAEGEVVSLWHKLCPLHLLEREGKYCLLLWPLFKVKAENNLL